MPTRAARFLRNKSKLFLVVCCLFFVFGFAVPVAGYLTAQVRLSLCHEQFSHLNPLRRCTDDVPLQQEYEAFRDELLAWVKHEEETGKLRHISIYFRDLEGGPWFGIEEEETFSAASLLKVPIMMAVLQQAEHRPDLLSQQLSYKGALDGQPNVFESDKTIFPGEYYTVDELLRRMIVYSDNLSKELLKARLLSLDPEHDLLIQSYQELGIFSPEKTLDDFITVKMYSSIFRMLYNASYLSKEMSEKALNLLTQVEFQDGLVASVPASVPVAHKFGVREHKGEEQLHDCGIVYHPRTPYLLCVMTRSRDRDENIRIIQEASRRVYQEVEERSALNAQ